MKTIIYVYHPKLNIFAIRFLNFINQTLLFMNNGIKKLIIIPILIFAISCNSIGDNTNSFVLLKTTMGDIKIKLYDETPMHRDNFIKLANSGVYNGVLFHRVIKEFMIQTGDPKTKAAGASTIPDSLNNYTIPAEINKAFYHKKGALAAARQGNEVNPLMRSSGTQFYIVQGSKLTSEELNMSELQINSNIKQAFFTRVLRETADSLKALGQTFNQAILQDLSSVKMFSFLANYIPFKLTEEQRNVYKTSGGTPRLDGAYTVFGEVVEGLDVVDKIAVVPTDATDKPLTDLRILSIKIVKK
jgi:peptidylprolyl isomerase